MQTEASPAVLLEGDGIAAVCVARLLTDAGVPCLWQPNARPKLAAILLGEQTQHLLRELFPQGDGHPEDLFDGFVRVNRRIVLWGNATEALDLPHNGVVAPEDELLRRLWKRVPSLDAFAGTPHEPVTWRVQTSRATLSAHEERDFGNRKAHFALVALREETGQDACWVESVEHGWLFLLALGDGKATLIAVGDTTESLLSSSRLIRSQIAQVIDRLAAVASHPRLTHALAGSRAIACGSAAMSFDPLCGEGAGNAVREAFLAAAVVRASLAGHSREQLAALYAERLRRGFLRHLQVCLQFYSTGGDGAFWTTEASTLQAGIRSLQMELADETPLQFRLVDRELIPVQSA